MTKEAQNNVEEMREDIKMAQENAVAIQQEFAATSQQSEVSSMLQVIAQCARDPNIDISKMTALRDMRDHELARLKEEAFSADYVNMKAELPLVIRPKYNEQTKSWYAAIEDINKEIDPILKKYGFATSTPIVAQTSDTVTVAAILRHRSGHSERTELMLPMDTKGPQGTVNKTMIHGLSSSVKYGMRVALCSLLNISTGDDKDGNKLNAEGVPKKKSFQDNVQADANKSSKNSYKEPPTVMATHDFKDLEIKLGGVQRGEKEPKWDKKTISLPGDKTIIFGFKSSQEAGEQLLQEMATYASKTERLAIINLNMPIIRALIKKGGTGELITKIHKFADEGK